MSDVLNPVDFRPTRKIKPSPEYVCWANIRARCKNKNHPSYKDYGERGITICPEWDDFNIFLLDMGKRPSKLHSIERKDNNGLYNKNNCIWATRKEQQNNTRYVNWITHDGKTMNLLSWSKLKGILPNTLVTRFTRGWSIAKALDTPVVKRKYKQRTHPTTES